LSEGDEQGKKEKNTDVIVIFRFLILQEELQSLFPDQWLYMPTPPMTLLRLLVLAHPIVVGFAGFTDHLSFAMIPNNDHAMLGI
jgi:hypothetical protein